MHLSATFRGLCHYTTIQDFDDQCKKWISISLYTNKELYKVKTTVQDNLTIQLHYSSYIEHDLQLQLEVPAQ